MDYILLIALTCSLCSQWFTCVQGGSCWLDINFKNNANPNTFISTNVTREECCKMEPTGEKFYSEDEPLHGQKLWVWQFLQDHKCTMACQDGCSTFSNRCSKSEICRVKPNGIPKCICNPFCSKHPLSKKGRVCGNDGKTYSHHCQLLRQNCRKKLSVEVAYFGECKAFSCDGIVCAKEGRTCVTDQYNRPKCVTPEIPCKGVPHKSICATDGKTYNSLCHMTSHMIGYGKSLALSHHGHCTGNSKKGCEQDEMCKLCLSEEKSGSYVCVTNPIAQCPTDDNSPAVCGQDGVTYKNECEMKISGYKTLKHVKAAHVEACNASEEEILAAGRYLDNPKGGVVKDTDYVFVSLLRNKQRIRRKLSKSRAYKRGYIK